MQSRATLLEFLSQFSPLLGRRREGERENESGREKKREGVKLKRGRLKWVREGDVRRRTAEERMEEGEN